MSISDHMKTARQRIKVITVDPSTRRIEGALKDGSMIQVAVWDVPNAFRWPQEGEEWLVHRQSTVWVLDNRQQQSLDEETKSLEDMNPGEMILDAGTVINVAGLTFIAVDLTGIENGWSLTWDSTLNRFVAGP